MTGNARPGHCWPCRPPQNMGIQRHGPVPQFLSAWHREEKSREQSRGVKTNSLFRGCVGKKGVGQESKGRWWGAWHLLVPSKQLWATADEDMQPRGWGGVVVWCLCLCDCLGHPKSACHHHSGSPTSHVLTKGRPHGPAGAICSLGHIPRTRAQHIMSLHLMSINLSPGAP